ncbi:MAG: hypothetical protein WBG43_11875 [Marinifilaceae bacterium]
MRYIYLLITIILCSSCNKENQITNEKEKRNIKEREFSAVEGDLMSISFASSSESSVNSVNKVMSSTDERIYGDLPDEVIGLSVEILNSNDEIIAKADFTRTAKAANQDLNNNIFLPKPNGKSPKGINIVDGKVRIDKTKFNNKDIYAQIFGFQNHLLNKNKYKNIVIAEKNKEEIYSNLIWYGRSELKERKSILKMNMLNGDLHLVFPTICTHDYLCDGNPEHCTGHNHDHIKRNNILHHIKGKQWLMYYEITIKTSKRKKEYQYIIIDRNTQKDWYNSYFKDNYKEVKYELYVFHHHSILRKIDRNDQPINSVQKGDPKIENIYYTNNDGECDIYLKNAELCTVSIDLSIYRCNNDNIENPSDYTYKDSYNNIDKGLIFPKDGYKRKYTIRSETYLPTHREINCKYQFYYKKNNLVHWYCSEILDTYTVKTRQRVSAQYSSNKGNTKASPLGISLEEIKLN